MRHLELSIEAIFSSAWEEQTTIDLAAQCRESCLHHHITVHTQLYASCFYDVLYNAASSSPWFPDKGTLFVPSHLRILYVSAESVPWLASAFFVRLCVEVRDLKWHLRGTFCVKKYVSEYTFIMFSKFYSKSYFYIWKLSRDDSGIG